MAKEKRAEHRNGVRGRAPRKPTPMFFDWRKPGAGERYVGASDPFAEEIHTYADRLDELLKYEGQYVVIQGSEVVGVFAERRDALGAAVERFRERPALVKRIVAKEPVLSLGGAVI